MIVELSQNKIIPEALTIWQEHGENIDVQMDLKNLTFAPDSINKIFAFNVLDHLFENEVKQALNNWNRCLKKGGKLYITVDDFEFVARSVLSGEYDIDLMNKKFAHPMYFTKDNIVAFLRDVGYTDDNIVFWFADIEGLLEKKEHELLIEVTKK